MKTTNSKIVSLLLIISLLPLLLIGCSSEPAPNASSVSSPGTNTNVAIGPQVGNLAPVFSFISANGERIYLSDLRGKAVMLNFWATWCGPCKAEMPLLEALSREERQDLILLTINSGESNNTVKAFMERQGYSFAVLLDAQEQITQTYQIRGIPTTFFIDKNGVIQYVKIGAFSSKLELIHLCDKILEY